MTCDPDVPNRAGQPRLWLAVGWTIVLWHAAVLVLRTYETELPRRPLPPPEP